MENLTEHFINEGELLESFPVPAMLFDRKQRLIVGINRLWINALGISRLQSLDEFDMIVELSEFSSMIQTVGRETENRLFKILPKQHLPFEARCFMRLVSDTPELVQVFLVPEVAQQIEDLFEQIDRLRLGEATSIAETHLRIDMIEQRRLEEQLQVTYDILLSKLVFVQQIVDAFPSPMLFVDTEGFIRSCNKAFANIFDSLPDQIIGKKLENQIPDRFDLSLLRNIQELILKPGHSTKEYRLRLLGYSRTLLISLASIYDKDREIRGVVGIGTDITGHKRLESALIASEERLQLAYQATHDGFWDWNRTTTEYYVSPRLTEILAFGENDPVYDFIWMWSRFHPDNRHEQGILLDLFRGKSTANEFNCEFRYLCGDNVYRWFSINTIVLRDQDGMVKRMVGSVDNIDQRKRDQAKVEYLATHDALTGLPNRVLLVDRVEQELALSRRENSQCAVVFADLDHFKEINDTLGHDIGDKLLCEMANRLTKSVREFDTVSRIGGDEFVLLLCKVQTREEVIPIIERVMEESRSAFMLLGQPYYISGSMGIAMFPHDGLDPATLMRRADEAMYVAKRSGRNKFVFWEERLLHPAQGDLSR